MGIAVAVMRAAALPHILAGDAAATGKRENQGPGLPGCNSFDTTNVGLYAKIFVFLGFLIKKVISAPLVRMRSGIPLLKDIEIGTAPTQHFLTLPQRI